MGFKVNSRVFNKRMKKLSQLPDVLLDAALPITKENTPIKSGYARANTKKQTNKILSDYGYAGSLNKGSSKQAPRGFTAPTIEQLEKEANKFVRKI